MQPYYPQAPAPYAPAGPVFQGLPADPFDTEAMQGSLQQLLSKNLGEYVVVEFLIGTQSMTNKQGILYGVGRSTITLFEEPDRTFVVCDIFSIKFVTFYLPGQRPGQTGVIPNGLQDIMRHPDYNPPQIPGTVVLSPPQAPQYRMPGME
ncbi:MAG: hypothetical protein RR211_02960 [Pseudoflavonifractor sp.]